MYRGYYDFCENYYMKGKSLHAHLLTQAGPSQAGWDVFHTMI